MLYWDSVFKITGKSGLPLGDLGQEFVCVKSLQRFSLCAEYCSTEQEKREAMGFLMKDGQEFLITFYYFSFLFAMNLLSNDLFGYEVEVVGNLTEKRWIREYVFVLSVLPTLGQVHVHHFQSIIKNNN